ncbi:MAG: hypothetical protein DU429_05160 [Candidatus Tokpelaia sp.]|nr:MAG: hypothetical protein DU430_07890 [Candidatus Tokpelaia sp.]KAA6206851.1 MAG: hypothetical protein DU429_05160 [Candidatus Tokpelaia sp.]
MGQTFLKNNQTRSPRLFRHRLRQRCRLIDIILQQAAGIRCPSPGAMSLPARPPQEARSADRLACGATGTKEQGAARA